MAQGGSSRPGDKRCRLPLDWVDDCVGADDAPLGLGQIPLERLGVLIALMYQLGLVCEVLGRLIAVPADAWRRKLRLRSG